MERQNRRVLDKHYNAEYSKVKLFPYNIQAGPVWCHEPKFNLIIEHGCIGIPGTTVTIIWLWVVQVPHGTLDTGIC